MSDALYVGVCLAGVLGGFKVLSNNFGQAVRESAPAPRYWAGRAIVTSVVGALCLSATAEPTPTTAPLPVLVSAMLVWVAFYHPRLGG